MKLRGLLATLVGISSLWLSATPARAAAGAITIKGSDTMVILGQRWAEDYMKKNPSTVIQVTGGGSGTGISALINGTTDICASSARDEGRPRRRSCATATTTAASRFRWRVTVSPST